MKKTLEDLEIQYTKILNYVQAQMDSIPGHLVCGKNKHGYQYYHSLKPGERKYLGKDEMDLVEKLAEQEYYKEIEKRLVKSLRQLSQIL